MQQNQLNMWLSMNADKFRQQDLTYIQNVLVAMPDEQMIYLQGAEYKKPSTIFLIAFFLGWERFFLDDIGLGILKVITGYGCGIWWLIDIFTAKKRAQKYNFQQFQKATAFVGGDTNAQSVVTNGFSNADSPTNKNNSSNKNIIVIVVVIAVLIGGGLSAYHNWDSWFEPDVSNQTDIYNLINSQLSGTNSTTTSTLDGIFSESQKAKQAVEKSATEEIVTDANSQTGQIHSIDEETQTYSGNNNSTYSLDHYLLTESDLRGLSKWDLRILRNEIYARHGYIFKSKDLREYFSAQDWYQPQYNDVSHLLNKIEKQNVEFIKRHE
ncbi:hypothetical protein FACS1894207_2490 [Bacteroidia bacterium]|nr:hypothetical protein FACS1894207_2490 [Bacteroidia bacterium]